VSYPADGGPRFTVGETEWFSYAGGGSVDAYVYDRAYCCRIVGAFHATALPRSRPRAERNEATRNRAIGLAAMLEAEYVTPAKGTEG
jgi:hypothetical protein